MKRLFCYAILLLVGVLMQVQGNCDYKDEVLSVGVHYRECLKINCDKDGRLSMLTCPLQQCSEDKLIGYHELDISKPYPECCERPICKTD